MKKELFFFNSIVIKPFFFKKAILLCLPIKALLRSFNINNHRLVIIDTFSTFFALKLSKIKRFEKKIHLKFFTVLKQTTKFLQLKNKNVGNFLLLNNFFYFGPQKFHFSFDSYKQLTTLKNINYLTSFITNITFLNKFKNQVAFLNKALLQKGFIKFYFNGLLIKKQVNRKSFNKQNFKKIAYFKKLFFLKKPLVKRVPTSNHYKNMQKYFLELNKIFFLVSTIGKFKSYNSKTLTIQMFALKKKVYKKDFRFSIILNLKIKRHFYKKTKKY